MSLLQHLEAQGQTQFVIATHSPILLACPGAQIYSFDASRIREVDYQDTTHYQVYKQFFMDITASDPERKEDANRKRQIAL